MPRRRRRCVCVVTSPREGIDSLRSSRGYALRICPAKGHRAGGVLEGIRSRLSDVPAFRILTGIAEDELARPEQILARFALAVIVRVLPRRQEHGVRHPAADARLRDAVAETEMLVPGERSG